MRPITSGSPKSKNQILNQYFLAYESTRSKSPKRSRSLSRTSKRSSLRRNPERSLSRSSKGSLKDHP